MAQPSNSNPSSTKNDEIPKISPEVIKNTQELAAQAAMRAQQMLRRASQGENQKVPEVPARSTDRKAPEVPPKRLSLKKTFTPAEIAAAGDAGNGSGQPNQQPAVPIPQRNLPQKAPPVPQKPSSVQNSPLPTPKRPENKIQASPLLSVRPQGSPQLPARLKQSVITANASSASNSIQTTDSPPLAVTKSQSNTSNNSPQLSQRSNVSNLSSLTSSPLPIQKTNNSSKSSSKTTISPSEELGSEDALRGIESGLRNMERAMQEQMNLRSMEAAAAAAANQLQNRQFNPLEFKPSGIRTVGSIDRLDGSSNQNIRIMENLRLNFEASMSMRTMGRNLSMDQMQLESLQNSVRQMDANSSSLRGSMESQIKMGYGGPPQQQQPPMQFRSLDRHLPLELQYSRHRTEIDFLRNLDPRIQQQFLQRQQQLQQVQQQQQQQQQSQQGSLNRDDLRLRRRSSHDETQYSQGAANAAGKYLTFTYENNLIAFS